MAILYVYISWSGSWHRYSTQPSASCSSCAKTTSELILYYHGDETQRCSNIIPIGAERDVKLTQASNNLSWTECTAIKNGSIKLEAYACYISLNIVIAIDNNIQVWTIFVCSGCKIFPSDTPRNHTRSGLIVDRCWLPLAQFHTAFNQRKNYQSIN